MPFCSTTSRLSAITKRWGHSQSGPSSLQMQEPFINVDFVSESLRCAICLGILVEPTETPCQHLFCESCIEEVYLVPSLSGRCPTCQQNAPMESLSHNDLARSLVSELAVRCPNHDRHGPDTVVGNGLQARKANCSSLLVCVFLGSLSECQQDSKS